MELKVNKKHTFSEGSPITLNLTSDVQNYYLSGTVVLAGNFLVQTTGTAVDGMEVWLYYDGTAVTLGANTVTIINRALTARQAVLRLICFATYVTSAWVVRVFVDNSQTAWIVADDFNSAVVDDSTIEIDSSNGLQLKDGGITNAKINASAAIAYSKLALTGSILNADINASAAIAYTKLALTGSILNADINAAAAIAYSKLALTGGILNADINAAAAIAYSKLALTGSILNADVNAAAAIAYSKLALTGSILNADIGAAAAIAFTKLATLTASRVPQISAAGVIEASSVTSTELGYLSGVTSALQTQIAAKTGGGGTYTKSSAATLVLTAAATDYYMLNCTANAIAVTLPSAALFTAGKSITIIRKFSAGSFNITVSAAGGETVDITDASEAASVTMSGTTGQTYRFLSNGTDSWIIAEV